MGTPVTRGQGEITLGCSVKNEKPFTILGKTLLKTKPPSAPDSTDDHNVTCSACRQYGTLVDCGFKPDGELPKVWSCPACTISENKKRGHSTERVTRSMSGNKRRRLPPTPTSSRPQSGATSTPAPAPAPSTAISDFISLVDGIRGELAKFNHSLERVVGGIRELEKESANDKAKAEHQEKEAGALREALKLIMSKAESAVKDTRGDS